ncbi:MAG: hypothetical protein HRT45_15840 [Bdellovibrionales bacterium]|nr:hypothetical protein [Bdellovibrionales bacterium]
MLYESNVRAKVAFVLLCGFLVAGCSATHEELKSDGSGGSANPLTNKCGLSLEQTFASSYHGLLKNQCAGCHVQGGVGKGAFADSNVATAFSQFMLTGSDFVRTRALDPVHQPPFTGPVNQPAIDSIDPAWNDAVATFDSCQADLERDNRNPGPSPTIPEDDPIVEKIDVDLETTAKTIAANGSPKTLSWNLGNESAVNSTGLNLSNVRLEVDVVVFTSPTNERSYQLSNPRLRAAGQALRLRYLEILLNGQYYQLGSAFKTSDRRVPANQTRQLSTGTLIVNETPNSNDTLALGVGEITEIDFNPPSFQQLVANNGVFGQNCAGCHGGGNPSAGFRIANYAEITGKFLVVPFEPQLSQLYTRMNDTINPMPASGILPTASRQQVLDWILDGAPSGAAPSASASGLPLELSANNTEGNVLVSNINIPNSISTVNLVLTVFDADQAAEASVSINGNAAITLYSDDGIADNDMVSTTLTFPTPANQWRNGSNTLTFRYITTAGSTIERVQVSF